MDSILDTIKPLLGVSNDITSYDTEIINDINFALSALHDLGIGPVEGLLITGSSETWQDLLGETPTNLEAVKTNIFLKVRPMFHPIVGYSNPNSILDTIKKMLGLQLDDDAFDTDVIVDINATLMTLSQLGVGPIEGFSITGSTETWVDFLGDVVNLEAVKSYIYLKVRVIFDPPTISTLLDAMTRQITEFEFRLNIQVDIPEEILEEEKDDEYE